MQSKTKSIVTLLVTLSLALTPTLTAAEQLCRQPDEDFLKHLREDVERTGSHLKYTQLKMLENRQGQREGSSQTQNPLRKIQSNLSRFTLRDTLHGPIRVGKDANVSRQLDFLSGKQAVTESLQTESITGAERFRNQRQSRVLNRDSQIPLTEVAPLEITSHPWKEMLSKEEGVAVPAIFHLVPRDHLVVYFTRAEKLAELEDAAKKLVGVGSYLSDIEELLSLRKKVSKRLGIENFEQLETLVSEIAFVSEDISFYPRTHYALVLKLKNPVLNALAGFVPGDKAITGVVGDYLVLSTSQGLFDRIKHSHQEKLPSMANAPDLKYSLAVLEKRRDGVLYLSESFITRIVSPTHRINSGRRNLALAQTEALQYAVFAYRSLCKAFPSTFQEVADAGYIPEYTALDQEYEISPKGIVNHLTWGSIYEATPLSSVELTSVTKREKDRYEQFRSRYQSFFREFMDPVGVAITVGDQIAFHTIILPLIEKSEYNDFREFTGDTPTRLFSREDEVGSRSIMVRLGVQFDHLLLNNFRVYKPGLSWKEIPTEEKRRLINQDFVENFKLDEPIDLFNVVGNKIQIGMGANIPYNVLHLGKLDTYVALELKDPKRFEKILHAMYRSFYNETQLSRRQIPLLHLSFEKPVQNDYRGVTYSFIPTGFMNLFYLIHNNTVYFTVNQITLNKIVDEILDGPKPLSTGQSRSLDYAGETHNAVVVADLTKLEKHKLAFLQGEPMNVQTRRKLYDIDGLLTDISVLAETFDGDTDKITRYAGNIPKQFLGVPITLEGTQIVLGSQQRLPLAEVKMGTRNGYQKQEDTTRKSFTELIPKDYVQRKLSQMNTLTNITVGASLTPHGLESRVVVNNPLREEIDTRFTAAVSNAASSPEKEEASASNRESILTTMGYPLLGLLLLAFLGLAAFLVYIRRQ